MEKQYSIAIYPSEDIIALVKSMKDKLAKEVGWFHSKNSVGHITICEVKVTDTAVEIIKKRLSQLCDALEPVEVHLTSFGSYPNGAFFISPDEDSKNSLKPIMKRVHESIRNFDLQKSDDPHLSIARKLAPEKLQSTNGLFTTIDAVFLCDNIVLRKFDENIKQFLVTDTFKFNSNPQPEFIQGTLF